MSASVTTELIVAQRVLLRGHVQGVGYRPALARAACQLSLMGWVRNTSDGVEVHVEGPFRQVEQFVEHCDQKCPSRGVVESKDIRQVDVQSYATFSFNNGSQHAALSTSVPTDLVVCRQCVDEVFDPTNRRYVYLLTSCDQCGPRYTIVDAMPYERETTSMSRFKLCENCLGEYTNPTDRRFHAQTTCCARCGPTLENLAKGMDCLRDGKIVCVKGIGGYQLLVDALNPVAIRRLRDLKGRREKPFAVMVQSMQYAENISELHTLERELLQSNAAPIVVVLAKKDCFPDEVSKGLATVGLMLPTTPLHEWLTREIGPLVVTSGNLEGEPIVFEEYQACESLEKIFDVCIDHDRPIRRPIDDSVVRVMGRQAVTLRLARGLAPHSFGLGTGRMNADQQILAVGAHQKVAIAMASGRQQVLCPHLGDMDTLASRQRFVDQVEDLTHLYQIDPTVVAHDYHEDYFTSQWAKDYAREKKARTIAVQHHHAHVVAGMIEPGWLDRDVLGVAWDGTGLGTDGTIWGGEFLKATSTGFERIACLRPFAMPGGEAAIREPWRLAMSLLNEVRSWDKTVSFRLPDETNTASKVIHSLNAPITSSMGRMFDAVAALILPNEELRSGRAAYEGHFAALLESCCDKDARGSYSMPICEPSTIVIPGGRQLHLPKTLDWRPMIRAILNDLARNIPASTIAMQFHRTLAFAVRQVSSLNGSLPVVLGGGVFQNKILLELITEEFANRSALIAIPSKIPINDGGIAAGQLAIASAILAEEQRCA
jgi:hydrogenase maturation protein HypF